MEFTKAWLLDVEVNYKLIGKKGTCKNCFEKVSDQFLAPFFTFIDCDNDGFITSENIWEAFRVLKRPNKDFDLYACKVPTKQMIEKFLRTNAPNDCILKFGGKADGLNTLGEWVIGMIYGYIDRHFKGDFKISPECAAKAQRWPGGKDPVCEKVLSLVKKD